MTLLLVLCARTGFCTDLHDTSWQTDGQSKKSVLTKVRSVCPLDCVECEGGVKAGLWSSYTCPACSIPCPKCPLGKWMETNTHVERDATSHEAGILNKNDEVMLFDRNRRYGSPPENQKRIDYKVLRGLKCDVCDNKGRLGTGQDISQLMKLAPEFRPEVEECSDCKGTGVDSVEDECIQCDGKGKIFPCETCYGRDIEPCGQEHCTRGSSSLIPGCHDHVCTKPCAGCCSTSTPKWEGCTGNVGETHKTEKECDAADKTKYFCKWISDRRRLAEESSPLFHDLVRTMEEQGFVFRYD